LFRRLLYKNRKNIFEISHN